MALGKKERKEFKTKETCSAQNSPVRKHNPLVKVTSKINNTLASVQGNPKLVAKELETFLCDFTVEINCN
jgi:hypothetical protein